MLNRGRKGVITVNCKKKLVFAIAVGLLVTVCVLIGPLGVAHDAQAANPNWFVRPIQNSEAWQYKGYGVYNWYIWGKYHTGADVAYRSGTNVRATANGTVMIAGYSGGWGNVVVLRHWSAAWRLKGQWKYCYSLYAHLSRINVRRGQRVQQYTSIGNVGSTGMSTGPHLHFEIKSQRCVDQLGLLGPGYTRSRPDSYGYVNPWGYCSKY